MERFISRQREKKRLLNWKESRQEKKKQKNNTAGKSSVERRSNKGKWVLTALEMLRCQTSMLIIQKSCPQEMSSK